MSENVKNSDGDYSLLLTQFNNRESVAFSEVYTILYDELFHFTSKLYRGTEVVANDVLQDVFISILESKKQSFDNLINLKAYIYVSIKNNFKNYIKHQKCVDKYKESIVSDDDLFITEIVESEVYSFVNQAVNLLPEDCAEIIKYHLDGWNAKEIGDKMNLSERTVYNKKAEIIQTLRGKIDKRMLLLLLISLK